ncbi:high mobility group protein [Perkinsela sp. CCAP 1560/4]|nr:high mobility group protein [Perkinsela sp. CCAP 1560/4]|eukprot:KNH05950.1 high mobility group protein [Perkinsela sp. CCAP 1560/4]
MVKAVGTGKISPYIAFCGAKRSALLAEGKDLGAASKILGEQWKAISDAERTEWIAEAERLTKVKEEKIASGELVAKEKKSAKAPKPEKRKRFNPTSGYIQFSLANRAALVAEHPEYQAPEVMRALGAAWKESSADEKAKFNKIAEEKNVQARAAYAAE